jgi:hypothetical protein
MVGGMMLTKSTENLLAQALSIEEISAKDSKELGFMARALVICTLPHSKPKEQEFSRKNGNYTLSMIAPKAIGLPYGSVPRLLLAWITTEATRTKSPTLTLGRSLSEFMEQLGMANPTGGKTGSITRLRDQMKRLFSAFVSCSYSDEHQDSNTGFKIVQKSQTWWHPQHPDQAGLWESTLTLSQEFYEEIMAAPIPIDLRALKALKRSPMALDIYLWLTFRNSYLKSSTVVTWDQLQMQFGAEYGRSRAFKEAFTDALRKVQIVYPAAKIQTNDQGVLVSPSPTHVPRQSKKLLTD